MKILLIEPGYKNKYPPMALMKFATYHKRRGDEVTFHKGDVRILVVQQIITKACQNYIYHHPDLPIHNTPTALIEQYLKKGNAQAYTDLEKKSNSDLFLKNIKELRKIIFSKRYEQIDDFKWDRIYVTTLFTFYWDITVKTIRSARKMVKDSNEIYIGGVCATIVPAQIKEVTGLEDKNILLGLMTKPGQMDKGDKQIIDELPLDYSILSEIDYEYKEQGNFYAYTTRGCINKCAFCVVPKIEPLYEHHVSLSEKVELTRALYGDQKNLLLLDNNIMASNSYAEIIEEICSLGFTKGAYFVKPNYLEINIENIRKGVRDKGLIVKSVNLLCEFFDSLPESSKKNDYYKIFRENLLFSDSRYLLPDAESLISAYDLVREDYSKRIKKSRSLRFVDFNQGVDSRLITDEKMALMAKIPIRPLRIAFDHWKLEKVYTKAVRSAVKAGIKSLSNYLLYNFTDKPEELYFRMKCNVELSEELDAQIFSFPMKYHPLDDPNFFSNRNYIGKHWNRKYIRAIQIVLNATKGKVGPRIQFFNHAFGSTLEEFKKILVMPEDYILHRVFHEENGTTNAWWSQFSALNSEEKTQVESLIQTNHFDSSKWEHISNDGKKVLSHYLKTSTKNSISEKLS